MLVKRILAVLYNCVFNLFAVLEVFLSLDIYWQYRMDHGVLLLDGVVGY